MRIGDRITLGSEYHALRWQVTGLDVYGRTRCYTLEGVGAISRRSMMDRDNTGWDMRLTELELALNGAKVC